MSEGMDGRRAHTLNITKEILKDQKDAKILDAGAGTGIAGQMVGTQTCRLLKEKQKRSSIHAY